ncbi:site-specific integrase [Streptomyces sp. PA03-1a]|nr:site-specific integrase [Streptomyces sp. PA03-1a]
MASVQARRNRAGDIIGYRVKWRLGGTRTGEWQSETFADEASAHVFATAVEEFGHEAVTAEPPLRARNPCELTVLPRCDDDGGVDGEDIEFLTPTEVEGLISCMERRSDQLLVLVKYGTGLRWSEITALAPMCVQDVDTDKPKIRVRRAWKRDGGTGYFLGPPKTRRSRRTLRVSAGVMEALEELGLNRLQHDALFFTGDSGQRLSYATFSGRWHRAVRRARHSGLLPPEKHPTPHDLRHSHAAALISASHPLTYVQRRLGHESFTTTSDTYGHLLPEADDDAMSTIEATLSPPLWRTVGCVVSAD